MLCPLQAMVVLELLASVGVGGCLSEVKASLCTSPSPAESQASSSFLATQGFPPFSPLSLLRRVHALECLLNGGEEGAAPLCLSDAEVAPTSYRLTRPGRGHAAAGRVCLSPAGCLAAWVGRRPRERLCAGSKRMTGSSCVCKKPK